MDTTRQLVAVALAAGLVGSALGLGVAGVVAPPGTGDDPAAQHVDGPTDIDDPSQPDGTDATNQQGSADRVTTFDSEASFRTYVERSRRKSGGYLGGFVGRRVFDQGGDVVVMTADTAGGDAGTAPTATESATSGDGGGAERVSDTNVQEVGVDEADVLKYDGRTAYYSGSPGVDDWYQTTVIDTEAPASPEVIGSVSTPGKLLLAGDTLVVYNEFVVQGFDVSDRTDPERLWSRQLDGNVELARLQNGTVYLVVRTGVDAENPCPIYPVGSDGPAVDCDDVYHPRTPAQAEATYTAMAIAPDSGTVTDSVSFVGGHRSTATYMSTNALYLTYTDSPSEAEVYGDFLLNGTDLLDDQARERVRTVLSYDLSARATRVEMDAIVDDWLSRVADPDGKRDALYDDYESYVTEHRRELVQTGIVRVAIDDGSLAMDTVGKVPGTPLNQFSMDEHDGHLRIATTVRARGSESVNDVYVLDEAMDVTGSVTGMGKDERIYAVRFMDDQAYVVTFRQVDPFYVVDMSETGNPQLQGEVKLPGFSRYLHPLGNDTILGIGEQDGEVKAVTFDVSDPRDPTVQDSVVVGDDWSAISRTHHAFLQDPKHEVFFLPTEDGGHVYSYAGGDLSRTKTVDTRGHARRAMYLDDYLYVFGEYELTVVDETDWETETTIDVR